MQLKVAVAPHDIVEDESHEEWSLPGIKFTPFTASAARLEEVGHVKVYALMDPDDGSVWVLRVMDGEKRWVLYFAPDEQVP